jgi:ATP-dependent DNA ligase
VFRKIREIAEISGSLAKGNEFGGLLTDCKGNEAKYLIRFVSGNYKIGSGEKFFQASLARAFYYHYQNEDTEVKKSN